MTIPFEQAFRRRIDDLPYWMRQNVERVARQLLSLGAYAGSETDAVTDALYILDYTFDGSYLNADRSPREHQK